MLGTGEWIIIVGLIVLLFGAAAIPKLARAMGQAQGEFKKAKREFDDAAEKTAQPAAADEEQVRRTARDLGIDEAGKPLAEVKRLIQERLA